MVFESLINFQTAKNKPLWLIVIGIIYSSLSLCLANWIFPSHASLTTLFFTVLCCVPLFIKTIEAEESLDVTSTSERSLLKEHSKVILYLSCLFIGFLISFTCWFVLLPSEQAGTNFSVQLDTFCKVNQGSNYQSCMGQYGMATGYATSSLHSLWMILQNNLKVLFVCIIFSFLYGSGALYILTWNAMVLSVAIGYNIKLFILSTNPLVAILMSSISFLKHGLLEMAAYFIAGLAAGILSVAVIKHHYSTPKFRKILVDSFWLFLVSVVVLVVAALLEVYL